MGVLLIVNERLKSGHTIESAQKCIGTRLTRNATIGLSTHMQAINISINSPPMTLAAVRCASAEGIPGGRPFSGEPDDGGTVLMMEKLNDAQGSRAENGGEVFECWHCPDGSSWDGGRQADH